MGKQVVVMYLDELHLNDNIKHKILTNKIRILLLTKNNCEIGALIGKEELKILVKNDT